MATGATNKLSASRVYFAEDFGSPVAPPDSLAPLVDAARLAPSAVDAQPWRLLGRGRDLFVYIERQSKRYGGGRSALYRYHDGGACLANVVLAASALGLDGAVRLLDPADSGPTPCPSHLEPLAVFGPV